MRAAKFLAVLASITADATLLSKLPPCPARPAADAIAGSVLRKAGVEGCFCQLLDINMAHAWKPAPQSYAYAAQQLGLKPEQVGTFVCSCSGSWSLLRAAGCAEETCSEQVHQKGSDGLCAALCRPPPPRPLTCADPCSFLSSPLHVCRSSWLRATHGMCLERCKRGCRLHTCAAPAARPTPLFFRCSPRWWSATFQNWQKPWLVWGSRARRQENDPAGFPLSIIAAVGSPRGWRPRQRRLAIAKQVP